MLFRSPQAGVAIGLAALGARIVGGENGSILQTIILSSSILYELVGPASAKLGLYLSRSYGDKSASAAVPSAPELSLREQMMAIQERLARKEPMPMSADGLSLQGGQPPNVEEDEYYGIMEYLRRNSKFINRR